MEQRYYQKEIETMPLEDMKALQSERLVAQVKHVYENVPYYREKMDAAHVKPEDIHGVEDLHKLPSLAQLAEEWLHSIPSMTLTFGRIAVQEQSLR